MLVLAGPGSGKTFVIIQRILNLIHEKRIRPDNILVISFSKASTIELKQRFQRESKNNSIAELSHKSKESNEQVNFATFHACFFHILKETYHYTSQDIITEKQKRDILRTILLDSEYEIKNTSEKTEEYLQKISYYKNKGTGELKQKESKMFQQIFHAYNHEMHYQHKLDFDDMGLLCLQLFQTRQDVLKKWQEKFQYILIDEFQDINMVQFRIVQLLTGENQNLFVVGDDDQSIYRFRGAKPEIMLGFERDYPGAKRILLDTNYRSRKQIVESALKVIRHNDNRFEKEIVSARPEGNPVITAVFNDQKEEHECIIEKILYYHKQGGNYRDIAILCRTNRQPGMLAEKLMEYNIPFQMKDAIPNLYEHWIAKNVITYLKLGKGSNKRSDLLQILNKPLRYISRECLEDEVISWDVMLQYYEEKPWMCDRIETLQHDLKMLKNMNLYGAIQYIRYVIGYEQYLRDYALDHKLKIEELLEVLNEIQESAKAYETLEEWQKHIKEYGENLEKQQRDKEKQDGVIISTMHSSKGLEFPIVFIPEANEGITPYHKAVMQEEIEEERRLFYVAMTRAKELLYVFSVKKRFHKELDVSRFVAESLEEHRVQQ